MKRLFLTALTATLALTMIPGLAFANSSGDFTDKRYDIKGSWEIVNIDGQTAIRFSDDFKTKRGPDLKIFLSPRKIADVTGSTATDQSLKLSLLKSNKGEQTYIIPESVNLDKFESILIHCEAFSVLWGGFDIPE